MCFIIHPDHKEKKTATEDIVCYKILRTDLVSIYYNYQYKIGKLAKSSLLYNSFMVDIITDGLHSYSDLIKAQKRRSYSTRTIYKAIIPKGAKYYYNPHDKEYVSNQLIIQEEIKN